MQGTVAGVTDTDTASATAVVGPGKCRRSGGQHAGARGRDERSAGCVTTASPISSTNIRLVWRHAFLGDPVCSIVETLHEPRTSLTVVGRTVTAKLTRGGVSRPLR